VLAQDSYEAIHDSGPAWYGSVWRVSAIFAGDDQASFACMALNALSFSASLLRDAIQGFQRSSKLRRAHKWFFPAGQGSTAINDPQ
jgi:hypothetical protein